MLSIMLFLVACNSSGDKDTSVDNGSSLDIAVKAANELSIEQGALLTSEVVAKYLVSDSLRLKTFSVLSGRSYDVEVVNLTYNTMLESGDIVAASGIVVLPLDKAGVSPLLSYQHTTVFHDGAVPSNDHVRDMTPILTASAGFVTVAPDYIGYGASNALTHPYIQSVPSANSVIDLIRAARIYLEQRNVGLNDQLFLAGYSEGGYVSMAAHQHMETLFPEEFPITASVIGAGPYDVRSTVDAMLLNTARINSPAYFGFIVHAYDRYYELDNLTLRAIASPHHMTVDEYYDGNSTSSAINSLLPRDPDELFNSYFLSDYAGITGELSLKYQLDKNNVYNWAPKAPISLYHGQNDETVPYANSSTALSTMTANEAFDVSLTDCEMVPSTHVNCAVGFATFALNYLLNTSMDR